MYHKITKSVCLFFAIIMVITCIPPITFAVDSKYIPDFSENNLATNITNMAPDGYETGYDDGGFSMMAAAYFARGDGPVSENADTFNPYGKNNYKEIPAEMQVESFYFGYDFTVEGAKKFVLEHGAAYLGFNTGYVNTFASSIGEEGHNIVQFEGWDDNYENYYLPSTMTMTAGHAVTIVGWDDNYSKNNFKLKPSGNGAFLCKNSWSSRLGDEGYFWFSYENLFGEIAAFEASGKNYTYNKVYDYDPLGYVGSTSALYDRIDYVANVFPESGKSLMEDETLEALLFYSIIPNASYTITIVPDFKDMEDMNSRIESGNNVITLNGQREDAGYITLHLDSPVSLKKGTRFAVALKFDLSKSSPVIAALSGAYACENPVQGYAKPRAERNESFYRAAGMMFDLQDSVENTNWCIKAYTNTSAGKNSPDSIGKLIKAIDNKGRHYSSDTTYSIDELIEKGIVYGDDYIDYVKNKSAYSGKVPTPAVKVDSQGLFDKKYPSQYNLKEKGFVTPVKNQGNYGTCWCFASIASLETSVMMKKEAVTGDVIGKSEILELDKAKTSAVSDKGVIYSFTSTVGPEYRFDFSGSNLTVEEISASGKVLNTFKCDSSLSIVKELARNCMVFYRVSGSGNVTVTVTPARNERFVDFSDSIININVGEEKEITVEKGLANQLVFNCEPYYCYEIVVESDREITFYNKFGEEVWYDKYGDFSILSFVNENSDTAVAYIAAADGNEIDIKVYFCETSSESFNYITENINCIVLKEENNYIADKAGYCFSVIPDKDGYYNLENKDGEIISSVEIMDLDIILNHTGSIFYMRSGCKYIFITQNTEENVRLVETDISKAVETITLKSGEEKTFMTPGDNSFKLNLEFPSFSKSYLLKVDASAFNFGDLEHEYTVDGIIVYPDKNCTLELEWDDYEIVTVSLCEYGDIESISVEAPFNLAYGSSRVIDYTCRLDDVKLVWTSSNTSVATVDENGKVTAVSLGSAVISVSSEDGAIHASTAVYVKPNFKQRVQSFFRRIVEFFKNLFR